LRTKLKRIRVVFLDVDGVLTDGAVILGTKEDARSFNVKDGLAIKVGTGAGLDIVLVSGKVSGAVSRRAKELGMECHQGVGDKAGFVEEYCRVRSVSLRECCFLGDDLNDLAAMGKVGLAMTPNDACAEAKLAAAVQLNASGGRGAVREALEMILKAKGVWTDAVEHFKRD